MRDLNSGSNEQLFYALPLEPPLTPTLCLAAFPPLPVGVAGHCMARLKDNVFMVNGGSQGTGDAHKPNLIFGYFVQ